jgi:hypothetical protein
MVLLSPSSDQKMAGWYLSRGSSQGRKVGRAVSPRRGKQSIRWAAVPSHRRLLRERWIAVQEEYEEARRREEEIRRKRGGGRDQEQGPVDLTDIGSHKATNGVAIPVF